MSTGTFQPIYAPAPHRFCCSIYPPLLSLFELVAPHYIVRFLSSCVAEKKWVRRNIWLITILGAVLLRKAHPDSCPISDNWFTNSLIACTASCILTIITVFLSTASLNTGPVPPPYSPPPLLPKKIAFGCGLSWSSPTLASLRAVG